MNEQISSEKHSRSERANEPDVKLNSIYTRELMDRGFAWVVPSPDITSNSVPLMLVLLAVLVLLADFKSISEFSFRLRLGLSSFLVFHILI